MPEQLTAAQAERGRVVASVAFKILALQEKRSRMPDCNARYGIDQQIADLRKKIQGHVRRLGAPQAAQ